MTSVALYRGAEGEMLLMVSIPMDHGDWNLRQFPVDRQTVLALIEDGARMVREDEAKKEANMIRGP